MKKLILIDGNAILHRAFHAYPGFTDKDGNLVNAVYGFCAMFLKILQDQTPDYIIVCFDRPKPTFRKQLYVGYQATRPKMDGNLVPQIVRIHEVLEKMKVAIFELDGYEADDLIGTVARQAVQTLDDRRSIKHQSSTLKNPSSTVHHLQSNLEVTIVSGDRDMLQLVNSHVKVLMPVTGITNTALFDAEKVEEKYGIKPSQIVDYKALTGDASDNYPGVSGIGPKTAMELLKKYGSFENLYQHVLKLPEKIAHRLATDAEQAALAKKLATIDTNAPITLDLEKCDCLKFDKQAARQAFEELGFKSLIKRLESDKGKEISDKRQEISNKEEKSSKANKKKAENQQLGLL